ncbi:MAG TPA: hypothetical protein VIQ99_01615, partial [Gammaproteobacteria bacterium]
MRRNAWTLLVVALAVASPDDATAQAVTTHFESSGTEQKPRSNAGVSIQRDRLRMRADVALRGAATPSDAANPRPSGKTEVVPNLRSAFTLAKNLDLETRVSFAEWNAGTDATVDTRLRYRKSLDSFFDELDGSVRRSPDGLTTQTLRLGFHEILGDAGATAPLTIAGEATFEAARDAVSSLAASSRDRRRVGVETRIAGLMSSFVTTDHTLTFRLERTAGARPERARMLAYDQLWAPTSLTRVGFNMWLQRRSGVGAD